MKGGKGMMKGKNGTKEGGGVENIHSNPRGPDSICT